MTFLIFKKVKKNFMQVCKNFSVRVNGTSVSFNGFYRDLFWYIDIDIRFRLNQKAKPFFDVMLLARKEEKLEDLKIINADNLLYTSLNESEFIIEEILPVGLHIFCGAPKVGKSWLMLDLCIKVSKGEELWNLKTKQCDVLYLALEDTYQRLQKRLFKLTDEIGSNFHIAIESNKITNGLVMQLEQALKQYSNIRLVVIDTLQKIRKQSNDINYSADYGEISLLKAFADKNKIAVILVHHLRKQDDSDVFNKISGTAGIMGSSDTTFILEKKSRDDSVATLFVTGRDVEYQTFTLRFEDCRWNLIERSFQKELEIKNAPDVINDVISFVNTNKYWQGTATELLSLIDKKDITPQYLTKVLNEYSKTILLDNKISFATSRTSTARLVTLKKDIEETLEDSFENDISIYDNVINDDDDAKNI